MASGSAVPGRCRWPRLMRRQGPRRPTGEFLPPFPWPSPAGTLCVPRLWEMPDGRRVTGVPAGTRSVGRRGTRLCCVLALSAGLAGPAFSHSGGVDSEGCHTDHVSGERHCHRDGPGRYVRDDWHARWIDADRDCQNTRHEVLIDESLEPVTLDARGCRVVAGKWLDPYTGRTFTDPRELDIDHLVPLAEAHRSGGAEWPRSRKRRFGNDLSSPDTLVAVSSRANRSKGARDPARWMPPNAAHHCEYVRRWVSVKRQWGLRMDAAEAEKIRQVRAGC